MYTPNSATAKPPNPNVYFEIFPIKISSYKFLFVDIIPYVSRRFHHPFARMLWTILGL